MEDTPDKHGENKKRGNLGAIAPYMWKKGQSGNILGRPKGKTMKEWAREYLERMTDEERDAWMEGIPKEVIWKMSEGNPKQDVEQALSGTINVVVPKAVAEAFNIDESTPKTGTGN